MKLLAMTGAVLVIFSLVLGWMIVAKRYMGLTLLKQIIRDDAKLVKCHVEFSIMALLLFAFYLINIDLPQRLVYCACIGAVTNPLLLVVMALKPDIDKSAAAPFGMISACSFVITTIGFGGLAVYIVYVLAR